MFVSRRTRGTYRVQVVRRSHGLGVLGPADAILHHGRKRHRFQLFHVGAAIDHFLLVLAPPTAPHAQQDQSQDDDDDGGHRRPDGHAQHLSVQLARLALVITLATIERSGRKTNTNE